MSQLVTGEAVALDLRAAALPSRVLSALIDAAIQLGVLIVLAFFAGAAQLEVSEAGAQALSLVVLVSVLLVYPVTFETLLRGRTPGKAALGLRVVRDDGGPIGFRQALVRGLSGAAVEKPGITLFFGAIVCSLLNERGKRIGDLLAGTVVLRERVPVRGGTVVPMPPPLAGWAASLDLSRLPDPLAMSVRQFVSRADTLTPAAREELGGRLVGAVTEAVGPPPTGAPGWAVLAAVLAERRRREEQRFAGASGYGASGYGASGYGGGGYAPTAGYASAAGYPAVAPGGAPAAANDAYPRPGAPPTGYPPVQRPQPGSPPPADGDGDPGPGPGGFALPF